MGTYSQYHCKDPFCGRVTSTYDRKFNSGMAASLIVLYKVTVQRAPPGGWIHIPNSLTDEEAKIVLRGREYGRLRFWGFVEPKPGSVAGEKSSGEWRLTQDGLDIVESPYAYFPRAVFERESCVLFFSDGSATPYSPTGVAPKEYTNLIEALEDDFNYNELISKG